MRSLLVALAALTLVSCAHGSAGSVPEVNIASVPVSCVDASNSGGILVVLTNRGARAVAFWLSGASGTPYSLHPWAFEVTRNASGHDHWVVALEDYYRPKNELNLGSGDTAQLLAYTASGPLTGYIGTVTLNVRDTAGHVFHSESLKVCAARSVPNNSSKPTPLRGAA